MTTLRSDSFENFSGSLGGTSTGWEFIETQTASGSATIDVINLTYHWMYKFVWCGVTPSSDNVDFGIRTSTDNGSSWDSASSTHAWAVHHVEADGTNFESSDLTGSTRLLINGDIGSCGTGADETSDWEVTCINPIESGRYARFFWSGYIKNNAGVNTYMKGAGRRTVAQAVNGVRFMMTSGNIATGKLCVYGLPG